MENEQATDTKETPDESDKKKRSPTLKIEIAILLISLTFLIVAATIYLTTPGSDEPASSLQIRLTENATVCEANCEQGHFVFVEEQPTEESIPTNWGQCTTVCLEK